MIKTGGSSASSTELTTARVLITLIQANLTRTKNSTRRQRDRKETKETRMMVGAVVMDAVGVTEEQAKKVYLEY